MLFLTRLAPPCLALAALSSPAWAQRVVINEIHYDPADPLKPAQFIELHNASAAPVDLSGWRFTDGVKATLPAGTTLAPGGFLVLAGNTGAFQKEFGFAPAAEFSGALKKRGERLVLSDAKGAAIDRVEYGAGFPWPTAARGAGASMERINPALDGALPGSWRSSGAPPAGKPTPGAANATFTDAPPPGIRAVEHTPAQPKSNQPVRIAALLTPAAGAVVTLETQVVEPGAYLRKSDPAFQKEWHAEPMHDDGKDGDDRAGDGIFTAQIPPTTQVHRRLVRYRIAAADAAGHTVRVPYPDDECPNFAYFTYDGAPAWTGAATPGKTPPLLFPAALMPTLPSFVLLADHEDAKRSQWDGGANKRPFEGTFICDGHIYDHIHFHNRGQASTYNTGKNKWAFKFNRARPFAPPTVGGVAFKKPWDGISMNACASPWVTSNRGMAGLDEAASFRLYALAGVLSPRTVPVQFRVLDRAEESSAKSQFEGDLRGLYLVVEQPDGAFLDERGLPDGNVYRIAGGGGDRKHQGPAEPANGADWNKFLEGSRTEKSEAWWREHLDLPAYYSFNACNLLTGNVDLREGDNHYFHHRADGRWTPIPWDLDMMFIPKGHQSGRIEQANCLSVPALRIEYQNRCRELLDLLCADATPSGGQAGQLIAEYAALVQPPTFPLAWPQLDECLWNQHPHTSDKGGFYRNPTSGGPDGNWTRTLATADFIGFVKFVTGFVTNARPGSKWQRDDGDPRGYGYGAVLADADDHPAPPRPTITANALRFTCSPFVAAPGAAAFAAMEWRLGEIGLHPARYEIEPVWKSGELPTFTPEIGLPPGVALPGHTYRARVRMRDASGRWSHWSEPATFTPPAARK